MEKLDSLVADSIAQRLSQPKHLEQLLSHLLDRCTERAERSRLLIAKLRERDTEADAKLMRLRTRLNAPARPSPHRRS